MLNRNENENGVVKTEKAATGRIRKDVYILALIVFLAVFAIIGFTVGKEQVGDLSAGGVKTAENEGTPTVCTFDENGNTEYLSGEEYALGEDCPLYGAIDIKQDVSNMLTVTKDDGTVSVIDGNEIGFSMEEIELDDVFGTAPASADDLMNKAYEKSKNAAYAAYTGEDILSANQWYTLVTGGSASGSGGKAGSGGYSSSEATWAFSIGTGTWYNLAGTTAGSIQMSLYSDVGGNGTVRAHYRGFSQSKSHNYNTAISSGNRKYAVFYVKRDGNAGGGKNDTFTSQSSIYNCSVKLKHTITAKPSISNSTTIPGWNEYRKVSVRIASTEAHPRYATVAYRDSATATSNVSNPASWNSATQSTTITTTKNSYSSVSVSAYTWANTSNTGTISAQELKIDNGVPTLLDMYFVSSSSSRTKLTSLTNATTLYLYVKFQDGGGNGYPSGLKSISAKNSRNNATLGDENLACATGNGLGGGAKEKWYSIDGSKANGTWSITLTDHANKTSVYSGEKSYSFYWWDRTAPTVSNVKITASTTDATIGGVAWTNDNLVVTFTADDYAVGTSYRDNAAINTCTINYTVNGIAKSVSTNDITKSGNAAYTKTCTFNKLKYDYNAMTAMSITVTDKAGNSTTMDCMSRKPTVSGRLDTVAPQIAWFRFGEGANNSQMSSFISQDLTVTVGAKDFQYSENGYFGNSGKRFNNGSGIKRLYFYADSTRTKPINIDGTNSNVKTVTSDPGNTSVLSASVTITYDTASSLFGGTLYIVAEDYVGNRSDGYATPGSGASYGNDWGNAVKGTGFTQSGVYIYPGITTAAGVKRDTFTPQIVIKNSAGKVIASTRSLSGTSLAYTFPWENTTKQTVTVDVYYGCSGGKLYVQKGNANVGKSPYSQTAYTSSTGSDYNFSGSAAAGSGEAVSVSTTGKTSYSRGAKFTTTIDLTDMGQTDYTFRFDSNAKSASSTISITTRMDKTAPTVELLGFSSSPFSSASMKSHLISQDLLLDSTKWIYPNSSDPGRGLYAVFKVTDTQSGVLWAQDGVLQNGSIKYGVNGTSLTQNTSSYAKAYENIDNTLVSGAAYSNYGFRMEFKYTDNAGNTYSYEKTGYAYEVSEIGNVVQVQMFSTDEMKKYLPEDQYNKIHNDDNTWNVSANTYLRYKVGVSDFIGNIGYATLTETKRPNNNLGLPVGSNVAEWGERVLRYYVDPFETSISSVNFYQAKNSNWDDGFIYTESPTSIGKPYSMTNSLYTGWANNYVFAEVKVTSGLSPFTVDYRYQDMTNNYNKDGIATNGQSYDGLKDGDASAGGYVIYDDKTAWVVFSNSTKNIQVAIRAISIAWDYDKNKWIFEAQSGELRPAPDDGRFYIKQDNTRPLIESVFLSLSNEYSTANTERLLTFDANFEKENYTFALNKELSPAYVASRDYIFTAEKVYVYIQVTDKIGSLMGSGIESVSFDGKSCSYVTKVGTSDIYKTLNTYSYDSIDVKHDKNDNEKLYDFSIVVIDKQANDSAATYGPNDVNGYRVLPVLDAFNPYISLKTTNETGYLEFSGETDSYDGGEVNQVYRFKGTSIKNNLFNATLSFRVGISGLTVYMRRTSYDASERLEALTYFRAGNFLNAYGADDFLNDGWGYYDGEQWIEYGAGSPYVRVYGESANTSAVQSGEITLNFHLTSVKERIEVIAISGTGKYYVIELGPLFIDSQAPVIHSGMTVFSVESEADTLDNGGVDYNALQKIWTNVALQQYTNGSVYIYYFITDPASGIDDNKVLRGNTELLEKVTLKNVPVWTYDGKLTTVRLLEGETPSADSLGVDGKGMLLINGFEAYALDGKNARISYNASGKVGAGVVDIECYRLKVESRTEVTVTASDVAGNGPTNSTPYNISIDTTDVRVTLTARTDESDVLYQGYTGEKYTNKDVQLRWQGDYGASGFGGFDYTVTDMLNGNSTTHYHIATPQFNNVGGNIAMTYVEYATGERKTISLSRGWTEGFTVRAQYFAGVYNWVVGGTNTGIRVNADYYADGDINNLVSVIWEVRSSYTYAYINVLRNNGNRYDKYTVTSFNTVTDDYATGGVRPSKTASFDVKIDIVAPVIDDSSGNIPELSATDRWHYLAKSLRVSIEDDLSGLEKTSQQISENDFIENVKVECVLASGNVIEGNLVLDEDGLYRAYNVVKKEMYFERAGLFYIENYVEYTIIATDEAGNVATYSFTPQIDADETTIESVTLFKADGTSYSYQQSAISVGWVNDIASNKVNWADDFVYALITVKYGRSGFILQYREATKDSALDGAGRWNTISSSAYTFEGEPQEVSESVMLATVRYEIGKSSDYTYSYFRFRAISNAQDTELNYYKSYTNSARNRGTESADSSYMSIELETYEAADVKYAGQSGRATANLGATVKTGLVAIDKGTPDVGISLVKADGYTSSGTKNFVPYGTKTEDGFAYGIADGEWSKEEVVMTLALDSDSRFASGNVIFYRSSIDGKTWSGWTLVNPNGGSLYTLGSDGVWRVSGTATGISLNNGSGGSSRRHDNDETTIMSYFASMLDYTISDSRNNVLYEFYAESGAGKKSEVCRFGTVDGAAVHGIKIDMNKGEVQSAAAATFAMFDDDASQETLAAEYNRQFASNGYVTGELASYTKRNTVIVRLQIQKVGYSGLRINLTQNGTVTVLDTITYDRFISEGGSVVYRYYRVTGNGETVQKLQLESIAGKLSDELPVYVRIDNTTPIVYVSEINGTKATNWGWTDRNLYTSDAEYWYTSEVAVSFGVGVIENNAYDGQSSYSGYTLEYSVNGNGVWIPLNENRFVIDGINVVNGNSYSFRITSGAGMSYRLGGEIRDNQDRLSYNAENLNSEISEADGITPITAHVVGNGTGDYDNGSYEFRFSVDSNDYYYDYFGRVDLGITVAGSRGYDTRTGEFADYVTGVYDKDGNYAVTSSTSFKRGDVMRLTYFAKYDGRSAGANHNYFQNVTVSTAGERGYFYNVTGDILGQIRESDLIDYNATYGIPPQADGETLEKTGYVQVQFEGSNIVIVSYFIAEVDVTYGKDKFYLQTENGEYKTTGNATYRYADGANERTREIELGYAYYGYFDRTETEPEELGAYYVMTSVNAGTGSFRVTTDTERKDFILKYFAMDDEEDNLFDVFDARDFGYIDADYYNLNADGTVDETKRSYLDSDYKLNADITVAKGLTGTYRGAFDGDGRCITELGGTVSGDYGLFEGISGTVRNVRVTTDRTLIVSATEEVEIGLLARRVLAGGTVENVAVIADVELHNFPKGSKFGGVAAYSEGGNFGGESALFTDVRVTNNGRAMDGAYVGAVVGYMRNGTRFNGVYAFGEIEIYNSTAVAAGMLYGGAEKGTYSVSAVSYFENNVFVNSDTVSGVSNVTDEIVLSGTYSGDDYQSFVVFGTSPVVGGIAIDYAILSRLYSDFGYEYDENETYGIGTPDRPLEISEYSQILAINGYMNLDFVFALGTDEIDMSGYECTIAVTKVFNGTLAAKQPSSGTRYVKLANFAGDTAVYNKSSFGLFGQLNGTVANIAFTDIAIDFDYVGEETLTAGIIAAKAYENAVIRNVLLIGTETIRTEGKASVGGVVGSARGTTINDVFSINNIAVTASKVTLGGIAAETDGITLPDSAGTIFMLGRTEAYGASVTVGAAIGAVADGSVVNGGAKVFAIKDNVYAGENLLSEKPVGSSNETYGIQTVAFSYDPMRTASFASSTGSVFNLVFGSFYPIAGDGSSITPFVIESEKDFGYINLALYAEYRIDKDITFTDFRTIGQGLVFSGVIKGSTGDDISAEGGRIIGLMNVTAPLVYHNSGKINDLSVNVEYSATVGAGETFRYGAIAIISDGEIKNVTVAGNVSIVSATQDNEIYASGFVAESRGGVVDADMSKLQNSISALNITVSGGGTAYIGGYAAIVTIGEPKFSYGIATGTITVSGTRKTYAGLLVGMSHGNCQWVLGEAASIDYTYSITVNGTEIPKYDDEGEPLTENFCGLIFE